VTAGARLSFALCILLTGCGATVLDAARERGVDDLSCAPEKIQAYTGKGGIIVVRGCGRWVQYACFYSRRNPVCMREGTIEALPLQSE
jgi:hypothetical protein